MQSRVLEDMAVEKMLENANIVERACSYQEVVSQQGEP